MEFFSTGWWSALLAIVLIDLVLAGDNAIVINATLTATDTGNGGTTFVPNFQVSRGTSNAVDANSDSAPTSPNSSAVTAKIKSVCGSGR